MSGAKMPRTELSQDVNIHQTLSSESQKDLDEALDETVSAQKTWVEESWRDLFRAFAIGRKAEPTTHGNVEVFSAVEDTDEDLRHTLNMIYERYGPLAMYDKGVDTLARHWVVGYQSVRGRQTVQVVMLFVEGTKWTRRSPVLNNLAAMIDAEDADFPDDEDWAVVEKPKGGVGFKQFRPP
ncbi:MAG: hypothetical protein Q9175_007531 [Cornicularia normoerica]